MPSGQEDAHLPGEGSSAEDDKAYQDPGRDGDQEQHMEEPYDGLQHTGRRKRRKTQPAPAYEDIYVSDFQADRTKPSNATKDPELAAIRAEYFERLALVLVLDKDYTDHSVNNTDVVVLQSTQNEKICAMSAFQVLMTFFAKDLRMTEGKFRSVVMQQGASGVERKCWRPRIHKQQVHVVQDVRYPDTEDEWGNLRNIIHEAEGGFGLPRLLEEDVNIDDVMKALRTSVDLARAFQLQSPPDPAARGGDGGFGGQGGAQGKGQVAYAGQHFPPPAYVHPPHMDAYNGYNAVDAKHAEEVNSGERGRKADEFRIQPVMQTIELHVDSSTFKTTTATLLSVEDTMFSSMIEKNPTSDAFFVDRSPEMFSFVLEYLREKRYRQLQEISDDVDIDVTWLPTDPMDLEKLKREARFFHMDELEALVEARRVKAEGTVGTVGVVGATETGCIS